MSYILKHDVTFLYELNFIPFAFKRVIADLVIRCAELILVTQIARGNVIICNAKLFVFPFLLSMVLGLGFDHHYTKARFSR